MWESASAAAGSREPYGSGGALGEPYGSGGTLGEQHGGACKHHVRAA